MPSLSTIAVNERGTLTPILVKRIKKLIQSGQLPLGAKLPSERKLCDMLKVSRASVRQAIKALEIMGVVVSRAGIGNFINTSTDLLLEPMDFAVSLKNISRDKLYEVRQVVEIQLAGLTAIRASQEDIAAIARELEAMERSRNNPRELAACDRRFHMAIIRACGNEIFELIFEPISKLLWEDVEERIHLFNPEQIVELHRAIYKAIKRKDAQGAMRAMKKHLDIGYQLFSSSA